MHKYPRTQHLQGSRIQVGDQSDCVPFNQLEGRYLIVEEKIDGANAAVSFEDGRMKLQSRGHYLEGGDYKHFDRFKRWAYARESMFRPVLGNRFVMYGEWVYAKHAVFYDMLPDYFLEFDILDKKTGKFLDTQRRHWKAGEISVTSVPILSCGILGKAVSALPDRVGRSQFISEEAGERLRELCEKRSLDWERTKCETDLSGIMEGLYVKVEEDGEVKERYKWIRSSFLQSVLDSGGHWLKRPLVANQLAPSAQALWR